MNHRSTASVSTIDRSEHRAARVSVAPWTWAVLRDPLDKDALVAHADSLVSSYGRRYPFLPDGIIDLRIFSEKGFGPTFRQWLDGQAAFEHFETDEHDYVAERRSVEAVYADIPIVGRCLDVGGLDGRLRGFLSEGQEYLDIDPFWGVLFLPRTDAYLRTYPFATEPLNYICAAAEHLPLATASFDTVHIRSVLDHLLNPEIALREAYRVLRSSGRLIVGLDVVGGRLGQRPVKRVLKEIIRTALVRMGVDRVADHHLWHPSYSKLCELISECGFEVVHTHWQKGTADQVCYVLAIK